MENQYSLVLVNETSRSFEKVEFVGDCAANSALEFIDELRGLLQPVHGNGRPVFVIDVHQSRYDQWRELRRNLGKPYPGELAIGQKFPSTVAASLHLGASKRYVCKLLENGLDGQDMETNGITWSYRDPNRD